MTNDLTGDDVTRLLSDPSAGTRASLAGKVAHHIDSPQLSPVERQIATDIVRLMAQDASLIVREALSTNLKGARNLPHDVALGLARDVEQVALPILEFCEVLSDADLLELVKASPEAKQAAIARRNGLSASLSDALIATDNIRVVTALVSNEGARISDQAMVRVVDRFGDVEAVQQPLVRRAGLPLAVAERLVTRVSDSLRDYLMRHHDLSADTASELLLKSRERATARLVTEEADGESLDELVAQLHANGRLSPSLILRVLCTGDMAFFEAALAVLAGVPVVNARILIHHDAGELGLKSLYQKAGLPPSLYGPIRLAVRVSRDTDSRGADYDRDSYSRVMIERILTLCGDLRPEDADYLLRRLGDLAPDDLAA